MPATLRELVEAEKVVASPAEWAKKGKGKLDLKLALEIDGLIEEGLFLGATALEHLPDQEVVLQLEYHGVRIPGGAGPLARLEWNPLRPHNNKGRGPAELQWIDQVGTHVHGFYDNWNEAGGALLKHNLPVARPLSQPIQAFSAAVDFAGNLFRINNIGVIKTPEWVLELDLG